MNPAILAACSVSGVSEVYRIGGAQAIAALGLGTKTIPQVDMVVGPGNIFVTLAKKEISGRAGIEMLDPREGVPIVRDMLTSGFSGEAVVGRELGMLLDSPIPGGGIDASAPRTVPELGPSKHPR